MLSRVRRLSFSKTRLAFSVRWLALARLHLSQPRQDKAGENAVQRNCMATAKEFTPFCLDLSPIFSRAAS
jgi:hypothetical protein